MAWESRKSRVACCIPHTGSWSAEFGDRTYAPLKLTPSPHFSKRVFMCRGVPQDVARNLLVKQALGDKLVTHVFFVDTDIVLEQPPDPNEAIHRLMQCDEPIVSGIYRARQKSGFSYSMWMKHPEGFTPVKNWSGNWLQIDVIGMGCCLIKREVFEKTPYPWFTWVEAHPSEDFNFCLKASEYGYKVRAYTDVRCSHISGGLKVLSDGSVVTLDV